MTKNKLSPMMAHYKKLKEKYADAILLYRLGDFYEMFFEDAVEASKILDLTLTGRDCGLEKRAPMCGVPHHAADNYVSRLINAGKKVAICEQLTQPGEQKGMVKRDVVRVITPGTVTEEDMLDKSKNSYLVSVVMLNQKFSLAWIDITTGEFNVRDFEGDKDALDVEDFLLSISPKEIIANSIMADIASDYASVKTSKMVKVMPYYDYSFDFDLAKKVLLKQMGAYDLSALGLEDKKLAVCAAGGLLDYINNTQKRSLCHINKINYIRSNSYMYLDFNTKRNLELFETMTERKKTGSLYWVIDRTQTAMGARLLRNWLNSPLQTIEDIQKRQFAVRELVKNNKLKEMTGMLLANIRDIERIVTKISYFNIMPRDCLALKESIKQIEPIKKLLSLAKSEQLLSINEKLEIF